jgi:hypothetical protein
MTLELLALLLADDTTAVAKIGQRTDKGLLVMFEVPFPLDTVTEDQVRATVARYQAHVDRLEDIYNACQSRLVTVRGLPPPLGDYREHDCADCGEPDEWNSGQWLR